MDENTGCYNNHSNCLKENFYMLFGLLFGKPPFWAFAPKYLGDDMDGCG